MKNNSIRKRRRGFTLMELMIATALTSIALAGMAHWMGVVRTNWQEALEIGALVQSKKVLNMRLVRGGFGYGSGLQSAVPPVELVEDGTYGINIIYHNYNNEYYAIQIANSGEVYQRHQNSENPWWDDGFSEFSRVTENALVKQADARLENNKLILDYVLEVDSSDFAKASLPKRFTWTFRRN